MLTVKSFTFSPVQENTYVLYNEQKQCCIIDPGCYYPEEREELKTVIEKTGLTPVLLLNTHCHLDHVFGNRFANRTWGLELEIHRGELPVLEQFPITCQMYGIPDAETSPAPAHFLEAGDIVAFGTTRLEVLFTPGHSPASLSFYCREEGFVLAGDVLFFESIGRTDFPGSDHETLLESIRSQIFSLPDATLVYPGHGPSTTVRHEKEYNPFL